MARLAVVMVAPLVVVTTSGISIHGASLLGPRDPCLIGAGSGIPTPIHMGRRPHLHLQLDQKARMDLPRLHHLRLAPRLDLEPRQHHPRVLQSILITRPVVAAHSRPLAISHRMTDQATESLADMAVTVMVMVMDLADVVAAVVIDQAVIIRHGHEAHDTASPLSGKAYPTGLPSYRSSSTDFSDPMVH